MSEDFRIINEETFNYKKGGNLCLMLIKDGGRYAIECVTVKDTFGRKFLKNREEAELIFSFLSLKLIDLTFNDMTNILSLCYKMNNINEIKFMFKVYNKLMSQAFVGRLIREFKLIIKPKYDKYGHVKSKGSLTIEVYFEKKVLFGFFKGTFLKNDFEFELF